MPALTYLFCTRAGADVQPGAGIYPGAEPAGQGSVAAKFLTSPERPTPRGVGAPRRSAWGPSRMSHVLPRGRGAIQMVSMTRSQGMPTRSLACFTDARDEESKRHRTSSSRGK